MADPDDTRGTILVTGVGRRRSIGAGLALGLAEDGWNLVLSHWAPYNLRVGLERGASDVDDIAADCRALGRRADVHPADLSDAQEPARLVKAAATHGDLSVQARSTTRHL
ncbi:hypothetical protein [Yimella sp. cx-51]|uniref:hypothetical protein n=1 Tax=Yimella sp. cx-51 TaxID=2770551 RepID=UPI00165D58A2|nr:hypothetical protein [Yimella sp. cx-51]MBC9957313.1 hypothetical protein [Yimella sp. cx-51]